MSSFEGKPVTDEHPPELLTPDTCSRYSRGHAQNIRKGDGKWEGCVVADLHIQDEELIRAIQGGKREISCGYECSYTDNGDGTYSQHDIRGNHIAVVTQGRAGKNVAILDSKKETEATRPERKEMKKNSLFFKLFAKAAKDASPEELETLAADAAAALDEDPAGKEPPAVPAKEETPKEEIQDSASLDSKLDMILQLLGKQNAPEAPEHDADPLDGLIKELTGGSGAPAGSEGESKVVPAGEFDQASSAADRAVMAAVVKQLRPVIVGIKDEATRKIVTDSLVACMTDQSTVSDITKIAQAAQKNAAQLADRKPEMDLEVYQSAYDAMNPHKLNGGTKE